MNEIRMILIRHGMTSGNLKKNYVGCNTDEVLCAQGIEVLKNRKDYFEKLINKEDALYFSSPMKRCIQTTEILFENSEYKLIDEFREMNFGIFENKNYAMLKDDESYQKWLDSECMMKIPEGEAFADIKQRSVAGFYQVLDVLEELGRNMAVVVTHGGNIMSVMSELTGYNHYDFMVKNAEGYELNFRTEDGKTFDLSYNCI